MRKTLSLPMAIRSGRGLRLRAVGLNVVPAGDKVTISNVAFGSYAKRIGLEAGYEVVAILEPAPRPSPVIPAGIALVIDRGHRLLATFPAPQTGAGGGLTREGGR